VKPAKRPSDVTVSDLRARRQQFASKSVRVRGIVIKTVPNVLDRLIQQAILQVLTPVFDPEFSESSHGFRPGRSAHGAAKQVQRTIRRGYRFAVDMDLSKFFDRVQHDVLMSRVARKVRDKRLLTLIGRYLRAGIWWKAFCKPEKKESARRSRHPSPGIMLDDWLSRNDAVCRSSATP
jgi:retron-type reverse transcriptase